MIRKAMHYVWPGSDPIPDAYLALQDWFRELNPDFIVTTWRLHDLMSLPLLNQRAFESVEGFSWKADIARYEIVMKYGGFYSDWDVLWSRPLVELAEECDSVFAHEGGVLNNAFFGMRKLHPISCMLVHELPGSLMAYPEDLSRAVGVKFFTRGVVAHRSGATCLPTGLFNWMGATQDKPDPDIILSKKGVIGSHLFAGCRGRDYVETIVARMHECRRSDIPR